MKITKEGLLKLEKELEDRETVTRKRLLDELKNVDKFNSREECVPTELIALQQEMSLNDARIHKIKTMLKDVEIIDNEELKGKNFVECGHIIKIHDYCENEQYWLRLVSSTEADPENNIISCESLVGKLLIGKPIGAKISHGSIMLEVLDISV